MVSRSSRLSPYLALGLWLALILGCNAGRTTKSRPQLTSEHRAEIIKALKAKGYPAPDLEMSDTGFLVATFTLSTAPRQSLKGYAEDALMIIRNTMYPHDAKKNYNYRVTLNGPSPGPGMIRRYGVARYIEGDQVTWEPAN